MAQYVFHCNKRGFKRYNYYFEYYHIIIIIIIIIKIINNFIIILIINFTIILNKQI